MSLCEGFCFDGLSGIELCFGKGGYPAMDRGCKKRVVALAC